MILDFIEKNLFRLLIAGAVLSFIGVFVYAVHMEQYNVPPPNLRADFQRDSSRAMAAGKAASHIEVQHLSGREVAMQLNDIVAESLTFSRDSFPSTTKSVQKYFTPGGYAQYMQFIESTGFQKTLADQDLQSGAYVELDPLELSSGVYSGAYKWLFEVPVTISFVPRATQSYRDPQTGTQNRRFTLRAQFTRVNDPQDPEAVKIEIWQVLPPRSR
ncbi:MAG: hypothetical protein DI626_05760 [Micavibrio aeruginosavorus]|uniref:Uncharacterized protein n=1 Tax=Micavibrio aeruginosavorus TaxID=349221 RepID=A0A2W4ZWQ4_9BACT|nr:MAG: hypothetical protein DI626_05760 [Micavibrio aeruginosavorus]